MSERSRQDLRTVVMAVVAAAVTGLAVPAVSAAFDAGNAERVEGKVTQTSSLGPGRSIKGAACDPTGTSYVSCGRVRLTLPNAGRVLLTLDGAWDSTAAPSVGRCRFFGPGTSNEQVNFGEPVDSETAHNFGFNEVTKRVLRGQRTFGLECREFAADTIAFEEIMMSAVFLGKQ